jgi:hypothetical protein
MNDNDIRTPVMWTLNPTAARRSLKNIRLLHKYPYHKRNGRLRRFDYVRAALCRAEDRDAQRLQELHDRYEPRYRAFGEMVEKVDAEWNRTHTLVEDEWVDGGGRR